MTILAILASVLFLVALGLGCLSVWLWHMLDASEHDRKGLERQLNVETELNGKLQRMVMDHLLKELQSFLSDIQPLGTQPPVSH